MSTENLRCVWADGTFLWLLYIHSRTVGGIVDPTRDTGVTVCLAGNAIGRVVGIGGLESAGRPTVRRSPAGYVGVASDE